MFGADAGCWRGALLPCGTLGANLATYLARSLSLSLSQPARSSRGLPGNTPSCVCVKESERARARERKRERDLDWYQAWPQCPPPEEAMYQRDLEGGHVHLFPTQNRTQNRTQHRSSRVLCVTSLGQVGRSRCSALSRFRLPKQSRGNHWRSLSETCEQAHQQP